MTLTEGLSLYNALLRVANPRANPRTARRGSDKLAIRRYLDWCREQEIDPASFMRFRFAMVRAPGQYPRLSSLVSDRLLVHFESWDDPHLRRRWKAGVYRRSGNRAEQLVRALLPITPVQEAVRLRRRREGKLVLCRVADIDITRGYDPRSAVCPGCAEGAACAADARKALGFSVAHLRAREFDKLPSKVAAIARRVAAEEP